MIHGFGTPGILRNRAKLRLYQEKLNIVHSE